MAYATIRKLRDGRIMIRGKGPRGVEICAIAPAGWIAVGGYEGASQNPQGPYPTVGGTYAVGAIDEIGLEVQGFFDNIGKAFSKVVKNKWVKTAVSGALSLYGVPPGVTTRAMEASGNLVDLARGDKDAERRLKNIAIQAAGGDPIARKAQAAIDHVQKARKHADAVTTAVSQAIKGDPEARARLERVARRARENPNDAAAQRAAVAVRATVQALRVTPTAPRTVRRGGLAPAPAANGTPPRVTVEHDAQGRRVVCVTV